jgi:hypothetical protein
MNGEKWLIDSIVTDDPATNKSIACAESVERRRRRRMRKEKVIVYRDLRANADLREQEITEL